MTYYETLGVSASATLAEIKRAYRKLASKLHPDKGGNKEKFQAVQQAYETLSVAERREHYDRTGTDAPAGMAENPDAIARKEIVTIFLNLVDHMEETVDFRTETERIIKMNAEQVKAQISQMRVGLRKREKVLKRLKAKGTTRFLEDSLEYVIGQHHQGIAQAQTRIELCTNMLRLLADGYDYMGEAVFNPVGDFQGAYRPLLYGHS